MLWQAWDLLSCMVQVRHCSASFVMPFSFRSTHRGTACCTTHSMEPCADGVECDVDDETDQSPGGYGDSYDGEWGKYSG